MHPSNEEEYKSLTEELIGHYRRELAYIYSYHDLPPAEYYAPVKDVVKRLICCLNERKLSVVLAECWKEAWYREPACNSDIRNAEGKRS